MTSNQTQLDVDLYIEAVLQRKARSVVALQIEGLSSMADAFVICSGTSHRQVAAIAENTQHYLRDRGIRPLHVEGKDEGLWVLLDYGDVVVHIFHEPMREFYDLEGLWADAPRIKSPALRRHHQALAQSDQKGTPHAP